MKTAGVFAALVLVVTASSMRAGVIPYPNTGTIAPQVPAFASTSQGVEVYYFGSSAKLQRFGRSLRHADKLQQRSHPAQSLHGPRKRTDGGKRAGTDQRGRSTGLLYRLARGRPLPPSPAPAPMVSTTPTSPTMPAARSTVPRFRQASSSASKMRLPPIRISTTTTTPLSLQGSPLQPST